eukprot:gene18328-biopygen12271
MPKTPFEKLQLERRQLRRSFTKTFNEASSLFKRDRLLNEEITFLKTAAAALQEQLKECQNLDKEIRIVALDEIEDEDESDAFFDEVTEVTNNNRGKISKLAFCISEFEKKNASTLVSQSPTSQSTLTLRSKLPDLQLPTFDGKITDWHGFWERFQTQVGSLSDLPASSKFTYLIGQLRGEALKTVQGIIPSGDNYAILEETLKENFGHPRRIVRAHVNNILKMTKPTQSAISLRQFYNAVMGDIRSLEALKINVSACAPFIIPILEDKLPGKVRSAIGDSGQGVNFLLKQFTDSFRDYIAREEQTQSGFPQATLPPPSRYESYEHNVSSTSTLSTTINTRCQLCKGPHATSHCTIPASEKSATVIQQSLCLNCLNTGHRVSNCNARGRCAKCKGKHHTSIHGIRIHSTNTTFQRNAQTQNQPPSRANTHAAIITNESSTASSAPENVSTANSTSQPITTNCAPLLNIDINDCLDDDPPYPSLHINDKSSYVNRTAKLKPPQSTNAPSEAANQQIILKTAKAVAIANDKKSNANIFFDEGSQRSYVRAEFANQLGLNPESYELLSVSGFGGTITKRNYGVSTLGLETTSGVELIRVLFSDEIVKPINQSGCYNLKNDSRFKKLEFANDFSDEHFQVDILIGADAAYRFLGSIDNQFQEPFIQKSKFGLVISGPFPKPIPELGNPALSEEITSIHTNAAKSINEVDVNSDKSFASPLSFENLVDNAELSVQFEKILQHQSLNYDNDKQKTNAFIHDYQQRVEFRDGQYFAPLPWKDEHPPLPSNLSLCKNRLTQVTTPLTFASASTTLTKRKVLSMTSKLYDPLGMLSPVTLIAHLYIAALWDEKFGWDQPLPPSQVAKWQKIQNDLQAASEVHFPRWINFAKAQPVALHVFTDASKSALGVTAYLTQGASSFLLGSKSKLVARNKINLTIPQLELSAMFLGSQYCDTLLNILTKDFQSVSVHLWTDSEIALFWLTSKRKLKQFVQNKVDAINSKFPSSFWGHTSTTDNPADLASRGCSTVSLTISALWQHGPKWLCDPPSWPPWPKPSTSSTVVLSAVTDQHVYTQEFSIGNVIDVNRFNSYSRLLATSVYVYRFCHRTGTTGPPTTSEIEAIERAWLKSEQLRCYPQVVSYLSSHDSHDKKIAPPIVRQLNLFLDNDGLVRTKGRFTLDASLVLLPRHCRFTDLIILECHHRMHHVGVGGTIVALRNRFWVPSARSATRRLLTKCVTCKKVTGRHVQLPTPSELPLFRYDTSLRPFSNIGIDFTGHLTVKGRSGDHIKVYLCLFTCLTTRAINLEIVEDLSTSTFLQAFRRHCSVFSIPQLILSDNAQTFKRAEQDLQTLLAHFDSPTIKNALAQKRIRFLYIPARSPHWGGVYERLIGLTKSVLKKVLGRSLISLSELYTLIKEVQAILNDRPLTTISSDINDLQPLTPNHLLFGFNVTSLPHPPLDSVDYDPNFGNSSEISRAQHHRTTLYHHFLQRFKTEYLSLLRETHAHHNNKTHPSRNVLQEGDVVLVADTDSPRHRWPLGVVIKLLYGSDHLCRAACIRTANGHTTRSVIKLYPLELNVGKPHKEPNVSEGHAEHSTATTRPKRTAAAAARDKIFAQLIDQSHD